jgi:hypothetical protein
MFFGHLIFALILAMILAAVFGAGFRKHQWGVDLVFFFILLFLFTWAGGIWITPFGPLVWGVPFFSFLLVGLLFALLLAALFPAPNAKRKAYQSDPEIRKEAKDAAIAVDAFFWILIFALIVSIIVGYVR